MKLLKSNLSMLRKNIFWIRYSDISRIIYLQRTVKAVPFLYGVLVFMFQDLFWWIEMDYFPWFQFRIDNVVFSQEGREHADPKHVACCYLSSKSSHFIHHKPLKRVYDCVKVCTHCHILGSKRGHWWLSIVLSSILLLINLTGT